MRAVVRCAVAMALGIAAVLAPALAPVLGAVPGGAPSAAAAEADERDLALRGITVAGAEFTSIGTPVFDSAASLSFLASRGHSLVRIPVRWESLQRSLSGELDPAAVTALERVVTDAGAAGLRVVLDVHNYARYDGVPYGAEGSFTSADFADLWRRLSHLLADDPAVVGYGLMNEPRDLPTVDGRSGNERWQRAQQTALDAIRATGDTTTVLVSGYSAASMGAWLNAGAGQPEPYIVDPADNIRWEAHHYWDLGTTGRYTTTYADAATAGWGTAEGDAVRTRVWFELDQWLRWLERYGQKGYIGEFGWPSAEHSSTTEARAWESLAQLYFERLDEESPDLVWTSAWATGSRWSSGYALQYYGSTDGVLSTPLSNARSLEAFSARVNPDAAPALIAPQPATASDPTGSTPTAAVPAAVPAAAPATEPAEAPAPAPATAPAALPLAPAAAPPSPSAPAVAPATVQGSVAAPPARRAASRTIAKPTRATVRRSGALPRIRVTVRSTAKVSGTVTVRWRGRDVGTARLRGGTATVTLTRRLPVGAQNLTVRYAGSAAVAPSTDRTNRVGVRR